MPASEWPFGNRARQTSSRVELGQEPPAGAAWATGQRTKPEGALVRDHHHTELYRHICPWAGGEERQ